MTTRVADASGARIESWALVALAVFTVASVAGYWNFALHPERLPGTALAARFYAISFQLFAQVHILVAAAALGTLLVRRTGLRWAGAFAAVYAISFTAEHLGTGYGIPFGGYGYTGLLGAKLGGRVPALIPVSWFLMAIPSWVIARSALPDARHRMWRMGLAALWMVTWDLALDPAMSFLTPYWVWEHAGPYYGMPLVNLLGWGVTAFALMGALELLGPASGIDRLPVGWLARYYALVLLLPLGMLLAAGHPLAVVTTLSAAAVLAGSGAYVRRAVPAPEVPPEHELERERDLVAAEAR